MIATGVPDDGYVVYSDKTLVVYFFILWCILSFIIELWLLYGHGVYKIVVQYHIFIHLNHSDIIEALQNITSDYILLVVVFK